MPSKTISTRRLRCEPTSLRQEYLAQVDARMAPPITTVPFRSAAAKQSVRPPEPSVSSADPISLSYTFRRLTVNTWTSARSKREAACISGDNVAPLYVKNRSRRCPKSVSCSIGAKRNVNSETAQSGESSSSVRKVKVTDVCSLLSIEISPVSCPLGNTTHDSYRYICIKKRCRMGSALSARFDVRCGNFLECRLQDLAHLCNIYNIALYRAARSRGRAGSLPFRTFAIHVLSDCGMRDEFLRNTRAPKVTTI
jgi:hypothetical protein